MFRRIILVRHGQSIWNHDSKFTGWTDIPLTNKGKYEAKLIGKTLKSKNIIPNVIFTSVMDRCIETSNIINKEFNESIPIFNSWRLNEKHYGTLEGVPRKYIRSLYGKHFTERMRNNFYIKPPILKHKSRFIIPNTHYKIYKNCYFESIKNGESKKDVLNRVLPYFENNILYTLSENKLPLIVTHKHTTRVLMKHLLKLNNDNFEKYHLPSKKNNNY